jgi:V/A-type H+-transporting ATPase subunit I
MQFGKILLICGISSMFFGSIYDSIFGYEGLINRNIFGYDEIVVGFSPSENVNDILLMTVGLGIGLIAVAMLMNIFNGIKQKNIEKIFFEHNGLAGLIFYGAAIYALVGTMLLGKKDILSLPYVICFFVIPLLLIFFRHILSKLLTRKKDILPSSIVEFLLENIFEMLEVLLSFVTNTISFVRIGAFALNHAGMMLVVFLLAKTTATAAFGSGNLVVLIIGNIVVIGLEGLIVGIQVLRLEFYEIFGRFFAGDGNEFKPIGYKNLKSVGYNDFKPVANNINQVTQKNNLTTVLKK